MEYLQQLIESSSYSVVTAFILGLMTAISPCPLATNISAIGYISQQIDDRRRVFINGLIYTLGRATSYTLLAIIIYLGASKLQISLLFQGWGELLLGPLLIVIGLFMLGVLQLNITILTSFTERIQNKGKRSYWHLFILGVLFALAFCPYSGVIYFAMLIPMTISSAGSLYLPVVFAIATGIPVILFAWLIAFAVGNVGKLYNKVKSFEKWFRRAVALLFIGAGIYIIAQNIIPKFL